MTYLTGAVVIVRSAAIAAFAAAQAILLGLVAGRVYQRSGWDKALNRLAAVVFSLAMIGAIACGVAGR